MNTNEQIKITPKVGALTGAIIGFIVGAIFVFTGCNFSTQSSISVTNKEITIEIPSDYVETNEADKDFSYANGKFAISGDTHTSSDFMGIGMEVKDAEQYAKFLMDLNPQFKFSELEEKDDYLYFTFGGIVNDVSRSKIAGVFEHNNTFYFISVECETVNEHLLEDVFFDVMDTIEYN